MKLRKVDPFRVTLLFAVSLLFFSSLTYAIGSRRATQRPAVVTAPPRMTTVSPVNLRRPSIRYTPATPVVPCSASRRSLMNGASQIPASDGSSGVQGNQKVAVLIGGAGDGKTVKRLTDGSWPVYIPIEQTDGDHIYMTQILAGGKVIYIPSHVCPSKKEQ